MDFNEAFNFQERQIISGYLSLMREAPCQNHCQGIVGALRNSSYHVLSFFRGHLRPAGTSRAVPLRGTRALSPPDER